MEEEKIIRIDHVSDLRGHYDHQIRKYAIFLVFIIILCIFLVERAASTSISLTNSRILAEVVEVTEKV